MTTTQHAPIPPTTPLPAVPMQDADRTDHRCTTIRMDDAELMSLLAATKDTIGTPGWKDDEPMGKNLIRARRRLQRGLARIEHVRFPPVASAHRTQKRDEQT